MILLCSITVTPACLSLRPPVEVFVVCTQKSISESAYGFFWMLQHQFSILVVHDVGPNVMAADSSYFCARISQICQKLGFQIFVCVVKQHNDGWKQRYDGISSRQSW